MSGADILSIIEKLKVANPEELSPLDIPKFPQHKQFSEYGQLIVNHLNLYYPSFMAYLHHHEQVYDFIYPLQQMIRIRASELMEQQLAYHNTPLVWLRTREEEEVVLSITEARELAVSEGGSLPEYPSSPAGMPPMELLSPLDGNPEPRHRLERELAEPIRNMTLRSHLYNWFPFPVEQDECPF